MNSPSNKLQGSSQVAGSGAAPGSASSAALLPRLIAFFLPQFHPIPENNEWWGPGFTEWNNVVKGRPLFRGHYQPHLPADLGFYDLRLSDVREAQAELARTYGIHGFCYYHYWFNGRHLLERPVNEILDSGRPDFPFCLCWANENWSRNWDGGTRKILVQQHYSADDDKRHIDWLLNAFEDPRYIRVGGRPLFLVYRASQLPDPRATTDIWRRAAQDRGFPDLFLCRVENFADDRTSPGQLGFDAAVEFQPDFTRVISQLGQTPLWRQLGRRLLGRPLLPSVYEYARVVELMLAKPEAEYLRFPGVTPMWDNSARRTQGGAIVLHGATPELYEKWLTNAIALAQRQLTGDGGIVFVNAWNEWAEGSHLEPDQRFGRSFLEATRRALSKTKAAVPA